MGRTIKWGLKTDIALTNGAMEGSRPMILLMVYVVKNQKAYEKKFKKKIMNVHFNWKNN